jgi:hypothetical protein
MSNIFIEHKLVVFENGLQVAGNWPTLRNEELHNLYASPNVPRAIRMRWEGHAACMVDMRNAYKILARKPEEKRRHHAEELDADGRIILEWILGKEGGKLWT